MTSKALKIEMREIGWLRPYERNARKHSKKQVRQIADSVTRFGFNNPILVTAQGGVLAGHGRLEAAKLLRLTEVPTLCIDHLTEQEQRAFIIADNKLAQNATWDTDLLAFELEELGASGFEMPVIGFSTTELDLIIEGAADANPARDDREGADSIPDLADATVTRLGDAWVLGRHVLVCGDARNSADYDTLMQGEQAHLMFTDPPYNTRIDGRVSGLGKTKHREFVLASGEMSEAEFTSFLSHCLSTAAAQCRDGAIAFTFIDWRGMEAMITAGRKAFTEQKQLCVWNKTNGGMGTFYRSKHELVFVFKVGTAPHTNNFSLGETGRYRTNVWDYAGISSFTSKRAEEQARHPTPKPVALVSDAIRDCSNRGEIVLDPFGGSGSTLIAAEMTGRSARILELDPAYCDVIVRRYQQFTGRSATLRGTGLTFEEVSEARLGQIEGEKR